MFQLRQKSYQIGNRLRKSKRFEHNCSLRDIPSEVVANYGTPEEVKSRAIQYEDGQDITQIAKSLRWVTSSESLYTGSVGPDSAILMEIKIVDLAIHWVTCDNLDAASEAAWFLANMASDDEHTHALVSAGAIPALLTPLKNKSLHPVLEHALWALANIASDHPEYAGLIEKESVFDDLITLADENLPNSAKE